MLRRFRPASAIALIALVASGCDTAPAPDAEEAAAAPAPAERSLSTASGEATILPYPFTAEQIRDEWVEGLSLIFQTEMPDGQTRERWTVLAADDEGVEIEFAPIDAEGNAAGERRGARSTWVELRDHAAFPAAQSSREELTRDTALGELDGWLYRTRDAEAGTETELFFARSLPGAPVHMRVLKDAETVLEMAQVERRKP